MSDDSQAPAPETNERAPTYVVGIGASAGGLEALEKFFDATPNDTGLAFVIVQHLSPDFKSLMDELLGRHTTMAIHRVEDATPIVANAIYLIPPRMNLTVSGRRLMLTEQDHERGLNLPIDLFFQSLAREFGSLSIAVILSGTGSDGSRGIEDVKNAGGMVAVQSVEDAGFDGMPRSALATGIVDVVDRANLIPGQILRYVAAPETFQATSDEIDFSDQGELAEVMRLFRSRFGLDFTYYKPATINRRLERRITLTNKQSLANYVDYLKEDPHELDSLYRDLLVEVTRFFRDNEAFDRLRDEVLPAIVARRRDDEDIRAWVPACATGEEAYSIAMLLAEQQRLSPKPFEFKVFATDVHPASLEVASSGVYSEDAAKHVPTAMRTRYFRYSGGLYHVTKDIRQRVIFAPHDITRDPPFTKLDLISCRNVLIYLETKVQRKALALFHFGLRVDGYLMLGPSETVAEFSREFDVVDPHWRIFRKLRDVRLTEGGAFETAAPITRSLPWKPSYVSTATRADNGWLIPEVYDDLLSRYVPPSLLVNEQHELVHSFGNARKLLVQPEGRPTMDILRLTDGALRTALSAAIHRAKTSRETVVFKGVRVEVEDTERTLRVVVEPYDKGSEKLLLICLEEMEPRRTIDDDSAEHFDKTDSSAARMATLERELLYTKESLQATVEELETSNEELQATNEELVAANEELQSTNEELHSVNEELYTVNAEHQRKIDELTDLTNDMDNLLRSTEIGTIFLDRDLRIRKFTPAIGEAFHVMPQDVGRPIDHIAYQFDDVNLLETVRDVLEAEQAAERTVHNAQGRPFLERLQPYRTGDGRVDGVVLTFVDVSQVREAESAREVVERRLRAISDNISVMICYVDSQFRLQYANRAYRDRYRIPLDEPIGGPIRELVGKEEFERRRPQLVRALDGENVFKEEFLTLPSGDQFWAHVTVAPDERADGRVVGVYCSIADVTERRAASAAAERHAAFVNASDLAVVGFDAEGTIDGWNPAAEELFGYGRDEVIGRGFEFLHPSGVSGEFSKACQRLLDGDPIESVEWECVRHDGARLLVEATLTPVLDANDGVVGGSVVVRDAGLRTRESLLVQMVDEAPCAMLLVGTSRLIGNANALAESYLGYDREELVGRSIDTLVPPRLRTGFERFCKEFGATPRRIDPVSHGLSVLRPDGEEFPVAIGITPIKTEDQSFFLVAVFDVSNGGGSPSSSKNAVDMS